MNEDLEQKLTESVGTVMQYVEQGSAFIAEQAPLVVQEILAWGFWSNLIVAVLCFAIVPLFFLPAYRNYRRIGEKHPGYMTLKFDESDVWFAAATGGMVAALPAVFGIVACLKAIKAVIAPRLYVLDQLKGLL